MSSLLTFPEPALRDERVLLRPWRLDDLPVVRAALADPSIARFTRQPQAPDARRVRAMYDQQAPIRAAGTSMVLAIADPSEGTLLGTIGLGAVSREMRTCRVGYWVAGPHRGRGLAAAALRLLCGWAIRTLGMQRVELEAHVINTASRRTATGASRRTW